jgi:rare lipoprotein A
MINIQTNNTSKIIIYILNILIVLCFILYINCSSSPRFASTMKETRKNIEVPEIDKPETSGKYTVLFVQEGMASYYADQFHGRKTANGEIFDMNKLSAAHRTAPLGSIAIVTNLKNNKSVRLRINDRGPFVSGRILDLSKRAAEELDFIKDGVTKIRLEVLKQNN